MWLWLFWLFRYRIDCFLKADLQESRYNVLSCERILTFEKSLYEAKKECRYAFSLTNRVTWTEDLCATYIITRGPATSAIFCAFPFLVKKASEKMKTFSFLEKTLLHHVL